jgi:hypothetical protein
MAALTDETRETLQVIQSQAQAQAQEAQQITQLGARQWQNTCTAIQKAAQDLRGAAAMAQSASRRQGWQTWLMVAMVTCIASLAAPIAYVTWQQEYSEEARVRKEQSQAWQGFTARFQELSKDDQRRVKELLRWD